MNDNPDKLPAASGIDAIHDPSSLIEDNGPVEVMQSESVSDSVAATSEITGNGTFSHHGGEILTSGGFKFLPYNTGMPLMPVPEYGRNIQNMVDYCVEITDKEERTACAHSIVKVMKTLFPKNAGEKGEMKKFWDHLNIMARFELDIDFPFEVVGPDSVNPKPARLSYEKKPLRNRQYGRSLETMIKTVAAMEDGEDRAQLISMLAHQMKKLLLVHNPEGVDNARILRDLYNYSDGRIQLDPETYVLRDFQDVTPVAKGKKKNRKNKIL